MHIWEAILLGFIQGVTEFFPVSSSGHLILVQKLLGMENLSHHLLFDLICHLGTLGAILYAFRSTLYELFQNSRSRLMWGLIPLFPLVLILKPIKNFFDQPHYLGFCFLISALLIFASTRLRFPTSFAKKSWRDPLVIGLFQAVAILPGISRSGATISAARMLGWAQEDAMQFSFLLAIPTLLGGTLVQLLSSSLTEMEMVGAPHLAIGFFVSFGTGCCALTWMRWLLNKQKWCYFGWYCFFIGIVSFSYFF